MINEGYGLLLEYQNAASAASDAQALLTSHDGPLTPSRLLKTHEFGLVKSKAQEHHILEDKFASFLLFPYFEDSTSSSSDADPTPLGVSTSSAIMQNVLYQVYSHSDQLSQFGPGFHQNWLAFAAVVHRKKFSSPVLLLSC